MNAVDRTAVIAALLMASTDNTCRIDRAVSLINDLKDICPQDTGIDEYDIVYVLKQDITSEELKYSVRSVVENMPYNRIVFYCGCPSDMKPDIHVPFKQLENSKIKNVIQTLKAIVKNDNLTEDFWLFNDDFFIMQPLTSEKPICNGTLYSVLNNIERMKGKSSKYTRTLRDTIMQLTKRNLDTISYASHTPMLINRKKAKEVLDTFTSPFSFRSAYGNYWHLDGILRPDVKISGVAEDVNTSLDLLSTNDASFAGGKVGTYIRSVFVTPSKYEIR